MRRRYKIIILGLIVINIMAFLATFVLIRVDRKRKALDKQYLNAVNEKVKNSLHDTDYGEQYDEVFDESQTVSDVKTEDEVGEYENLQTEVSGNRRFITFINDDGYQSYYEKFLPIVKKKKVSISNAIEVANVGTNNFMTWEQIHEAQECGAEILNHTLHHVVSDEEVKKVGEKQYTEDLLRAKEIMEANGFYDTADILVYSGASAVSSWPWVKKTMRAGINSCGNKVNVMPFNSNILDRYRIGSDHVPTFEELKGYIDDLMEVEEGWEIWMMHSEYAYVTEDYLKAFEKAIDYCQEIGIEIVTAKYALDYFDIHGSEETTRGLN
ncbi:MAG: polysaccharide deacetylase family protein [Blautia sp.]|nr:polysaccharide deacetylase family protein [Blautia sp.]